MTDNIRESLEYAVELAGKEEKIVQNADGYEFYDENKHQLVQLFPKKFYPSCLRLTTLGSLMDYFKNNVNGINDQKTIVRIASPDEVLVYTEDDEHKVRTTLIDVRAVLPEIEFAKWYNIEQFNIMLQSKFTDDGDRDLLLDVSSKIKIENGAKVEDNGLSQITIVKDGAASYAEANLPNPVTLVPYRTFVEINQIESLFIFRINKTGDLALFEADGGKWKIEAIQAIKDYLELEFKNYSNVTILA